MHYREIARAINDRIVREGQLHARVLLLCECGARSCRDRPRISALEYENIRKEPGWFILAPSHRDPGGLMWRRGGHLVVHVPS